MLGLSFDKEKHTYIVTDRRVFAIGMEQKDRKKDIISDGRVCCDWISQKNRKVVMFDRKKHDI